MADPHPKSRKRSAASFQAEPPDRPIFFIDRSLGKKTIAAALRQADVEVYVHDDLFAPDAKDEEWLTKVGQEGWIALTKDHMIRYRTPERLAVKNARVALFTLKTRGDCRAEEMAEIFIKALPAIIRFVKRNPPPFIAKIARDGSVSMEVDLQ